MSSPHQGGPFVQRFVYPAIEFGRVPAPPSDAPGPPSQGTGVSGITEEQAQAREASAFRRGVAEGQQCTRLEARDLVAQAKTAITNALAEFARERETYFQEVEAEVIALSLAIARKILNRETQVDPLVLRGVVHVALESLCTGTTVRLCVPPLQADHWRRFLSAESPRNPVELVEDSALAGGSCRIETELGNTHLSVESQLKEIEQGFADLLARAPRGSL